MQTENSNRNLTETAKTINCIVQNENSDRNLPKK